MKKRFQIDIGFSEERQTYCAAVFSVGEKKGMTVEGMSLRFVLTQIAKKIRQRESHLKKFPLKEPSRIIGIHDGRPSIIIPARN